MFRNTLQPLNLAKAVYSVVLVAVFLLVSLASAYAGQVTLTWDASPGPDLKGYRLYYGQASGITNGQYAYNVDVGLGNQTTTEAACTVATNGTVTCNKLNLNDNGVYYFAVKAYNSAGTESVFSNEVSKTASSSVAPPVASFNTSSSTTAPLTWTFTNTSTGATPITWCWKFGDSTKSCDSNVQSPSHAYAQAGSYPVTLTASNSGGSDTETKTITVNATVTPAPVPSFTYTTNSTTGQVPLAVNFTGSWTGSATSQTWNFGDGSSNSTSTSTTSPVKVTKNYNAPGSYTVTFTVAGPGGSRSTTQTITATTKAPTANFSASSTTITTGQAVQFTDTSTPTGAITGWCWKFNVAANSSTCNSTVEKPSYTYTSAGTYTVSLTARNSAGQDDEIKTGYITVTAAKVSSGPIAAYYLEEASGTKVNDASGNGNHGVLSCNNTADPTCSGMRTPGYFGNALSFDGVNDWVTINDSATLDLTTAITLEAWVYPTATMSSWRNVLLKEQTGGLAYGLYANSDSNQPVASINIGGDKNLAGKSALTANKWTHLAATYDGAYERLYVNGTQVAYKAQTGSMTVSSGALRIGGNSVWSEFFKGRIDEIRVYNRALSAAEIKTDMNTAGGRLLGDQQTGSFTDTISKGSAKAFQKKADKTGAVTSLSVYVVTGMTPLVAGLYANTVDANQMNHPGKLLAQGTLSSPTAGAWNRVSLPATSITAGTTYWIAILSPGGSLQVSDKVNNGTQPSETSPTTPILTTLPDTWKTGTPSYDGPLAGYGTGY